MSDSIQRRFAAYDPDVIDSRNPHLTDDDRADARMAEIRAAVIAEHREKESAMAMKDVFGRPMLGPSTYEDRFGDPQWCDPTGRRSWD